MLRLSLVLVGLLAVPHVASAHAIGIEAKLKAGVVRVEAYYDDDTPAADAKVVVEDDAKTVVAEGTTDASGVWAFPAPKPGRYIVRVDAGAGHAAKTSIVVPDGATAPGAASISDGPSRSAFTGPLRWVMAAVGVALIAGVTVLLRWAVRSRRTKG